MSAEEIAVRSVGPDELEQWAEVSRLGFLDARRASPARLETLRLLIPEQRLWRTTRGGVISGGYRSWDINLPVPGRRTVPGLAITSLAVLPGHRRRGVARAIVAAAFAEAVERGLALAYLIPSQAPIYGRFGFGAAVETMDLTVNTARFGLADGTDEGITLEPSNDAGLRKVAPALYSAVAAGMPGAFPRPGLWWDFACGLLAESDQELLRPAVIARDADGVVVGTASYRPIGEWTLQESVGIEIQDLTASTPAAYRALWGYLAELEPVDRLIARNRPAHEPLPWMLTDRRAISQSHRTDFYWSRILDVPTALSSRTAGAGPDRIVLEVVDPGGYASGRWLVDADEEGRIQVSATDRAADVTLPVQTLSAAYFGQSPLLTLPADEHRPGTLRKLATLLHWQPEATVGLTWF